MSDLFYIRGEDPCTGTLLQATAEQVTFTDASGARRSLPGWQVGGIVLEDTPEAWTHALEALSDGDFVSAGQQFQAVADSQHPLAVWAQFQLINLQRLRAEIAGTDLAPVASALQAFLEQHPHAWDAPAALLSLLRLPGEHPAGLQTRLAKLGPVWGLHGELAQARAQALAGDAAALERAGEVGRRAEQTRFGREVAQLALATRVEVLVALGRPQEALEAIPFVDVEGVPTNAAYSLDWTNAPAAPVLLNAIGAAVVALDPQTAGAAIPLHQRVIRYYPDLHVQHARAIQALVTAYGHLGREDYAGELKGLLQQRYPDAVVPGSLHHRHGGGSLGD